jgi:hypothetical protein
MAGALRTLMIRSALTRAALTLMLVGCGDPAELHDAGIDAGSDAGSSIDAGSNDAGGADAGEGEPCAFNRECADGDRCECDEATGCFCRQGARGTGQIGVDTCTDGNDCVSAVCVEGPDSTTYYCSDECASDTDCAGALPICAAIAFVGRICVRQPP